MLAAAAATAHLPSSTTGAGGALWPTGFFCCELAFFSSYAPTPTCATTIDAPPSCRTADSLRAPALDAAMQMFRFSLLDDASLSFDDGRLLFDEVAGSLLSSWSSVLSLLKRVLASVRPSPPSLGGRLASERFAADESSSCLAAGWWHRDPSASRESSLANPPGEFGSHTTGDEGWVDAIAYCREGPQPWSAGSPSSRSGAAARSS